MTLPVVLADVQKRFKPSQIAGLELWLDANKITGLDDGDPLTTWSDQSGNGNDVTQSTSAKKPTYKTSIINGRSIVRFDGTDDYLKASAFTLVQPEHLFIVLKVLGGSTNDVIHDGNTLDRMVGQQRSAVKNYNQYAGNFGAVVTLGDDFRIINSLFNGASSNVSLDGGSDNTGDVGSNDAAGFSLGANGNEAAHSQIDVAEFLIYSVELSITNQGRVERYLGARYGIALG